MKKLKVLNLYAGIGGNRKLWENVDVTAVEINPDIAKIYQDFFPEDNMIVEDAHQYLLEHYNEFDFVWSSPPCPTHSQVRYRIGFLNGKVSAAYPDMRLYQEIILLKYHFKGLWVVENTEPYYEPLIKPQVVSRHRIWSNFNISNIKLNDSDKIRWGGNDKRQLVKGFDISAYSLPDKRKILRNCVRPEIGLHIFNCANYNIQIKLDEVQN